MGHRQDKLRRKKELLENGGVPKKKKEANNGLNPKTRKIITTVIVLVAIVVIAIFVIWGSGIPQQSIVENTSVGTVNGLSVTVPEFNFYYNTAVNNFKQQWGEYLQYSGLDTTIPFSEQKHPTEEGTWEDYFVKNTKDSIVRVIALNDEAKKQNVTLTTEDVKTIDTFMTNITEGAKTQNITEDALLETYYGKGVTLNNVRAILDKALLADRMATVKRDSYQYDDAKIESLYQANKDSYDVVTFRQFYVPTPVAPDTTAAPTPTGTEQTQAEIDAATAAAAAKQQEAKAAGKVIADKMIAMVSDESSFMLAAGNSAPDEEKINYTDPAKTLMLNKAKADIIPTEVADWVFAAHKVGDKSVVESADGYYVLYFISRAKNTLSSTVSVRHILINSAVATPTTVATPTPAADPATEAAATAKADADAKAFAEAAKVKADDILAKYLAGDKTEASFATLATENTEDPGSATTGGLYENITPGQMVPQFDSWIFDPARKTGDTGVVTTDYGYHVMYFVSAAGPVWAEQAKLDDINKNYTVFYDALVKTYTFEVNAAGMKNTK